MLNWIWGSMIVAGTVYAILTGNTQAAGEGLMEGAEEAVGLVLTWQEFWVYGAGLWKLRKNPD
jgi:spore maturation protein SpmA